MHEEAKVSVDAEPSSLVATWRNPDLATNARASKMVKEPFNNLTLPKFIHGVPVSPANRAGDT